MPKLLKATSTSRAAHLRHILAMVLYSTPRRSRSGLPTMGNAAPFVSVSACVIRLARRTARASVRAALEHRGVSCDGAPYPGQGCTHRFC